MRVTLNNVKAAAHWACCDAPRPLRSRLRQVLRLPMPTAAIFLRNNRAMRFQRQIALSVHTECDWSGCGHRKWKEVSSTTLATKFFYFVVWIASNLGCKSSWYHRLWAIFAVGTKFIFSFLPNLELRVAISNIEPNIQRLSSLRQPQASHWTADNVGVVTVIWCVNFLLFFAEVCRENLDMVLLCRE